MKAYILPDPENLLGQFFHLFGMVAVVIGCVIVGFIIEVFKFIWR